MNYLRMSAMIVIVLVLVLVMMIGLPLEEQLLESTFLANKEVWQFPGANLEVGQHWDAARVPKLYRSEEGRGGRSEVGLIPNHKPVGTTYELYNRLLVEEEEEKEEEKRRETSLETLLFTRRTRECVHRSQTNFLLCSFIHFIVKSYCF